MTRRRFTVHEYYRLAEAGILTEDDRVELIEGEIVQLPPIGPRHAGELDDLMLLFVERLRGAARVRVQNPVRLSRRSEPEPDLALVRNESERGRSYRVDHPTAEDALLVVEVADSSLEYDLHTKAPMYARYGLPEVWIADLNHEQVLEFRDPGPDGYKTTRVVRRGESLNPLAFPSLTVSVDAIFG